MSSAAKPFIRPATVRDCFELAQTMRQEDQEEIWHAARLLPYAALRDGFRDSERCYAIERQGEVVALFGVVPRPGGGASPWMLGADNLVRCGSLMRECHEYLDVWLAKHGRLANAVWAGNAVHIKWLRRLSFQFEGESVINGETFLHFHRNTHVYPHARPHGAVYGGLGGRPATAG